MKNELKAFEPIKSNRKTTKGRRMYFQKVRKVKSNQIGKTKFVNTSIKHVQASPKRLSITERMLVVYDYKNRYKQTSNPRTIAKQNAKITGRLLWDSQKQGTYIRKLHGELV